jgi:hypothetical protein
MRDLDEEVRGALRIYSEACERAFRMGKKGALLAAVTMHMRVNEPIPEWARSALLEAYESGPKSWDDVFGRPANEKWRRDEERAVAIEAAKMKREGRKVDAELFFQELGDRLGMTAGTAKRRYYSEFRKRSDRMRAELGTEPDPRLVILFAVRDMIEPYLAEAKGLELEIERIERRLAENEARLAEIEAAGSQK